MCAGRSCSVHDPELFFVEDADHLGEVMAALQDCSCGCDYLIGALLAGELGVFLDPKERDFAGPSEDREDGFVFEAINGVVPPIARGHFTSIEVQDHVKLPAVPRNLRLRRRSACLIAIADNDQAGAIAIGTIRRF